MQPESQTPYSSAPIYPHPLETPPQNPAPINGKKRVSLNPFRHFIRGNKNLFATNLGSAIGVGIISSFATFILIYTYSIFGAGILLTGITKGSASSAIIKIVLFAVIYLLLVATLSSITYIAQLRTLITASQRRKISIADAFKFSVQRFTKTVLTNLTVFGIVLSVYVVYITFALLILRNNLITVLGGVFLVLFILIYTLRMLYVDFILADNETPKKPFETMRRSSLLFSKSGNACFCMRWQ